MYTPGVRAAPACRNAQNRKDPTEQIRGVLIDDGTMPRQLRLCGHRRCSHAITGAAAAATRGHPAGRTAAEPVRRVQPVQPVQWGSQERRSRTGRRTAGPRAPERRSRPAVRIRAGLPELPERCLASAVPRRAGGRSRRTAPERPGPHRTGRRRSPDRTRGRISPPPLAHTRSAMRTEHENPFFLFGLSGR